MKRKHYFMFSLVLIDIFHHFPREVKFILRHFLRINKVLLRVAFIYPALWICRKPKLIVFSGTRANISKWECIIICFLFIRFTFLLLNVNVSVSKIGSRCVSPLWRYDEIDMLLPIEKSRRSQKLPVRSVKEI